MKYLNLIAKALGVTVIKTSSWGYSGYNISGIGVADVFVGSLDEVAERLAKVIEHRQQHLERLKQQDKETAKMLGEAVEITNQLLGKGAAS